MRLEETEIKLKTMLGHTYRLSLDNKLHTILDYEVVENKIRIKTNEQVFEKPIETTATFLSGFRAENVLTSIGKEEVLPAWKNKMNGNLESLGDLLFSNLQKLKDDPSFVEQAREINNHVNTIINLAKVQIQLNRFN